MSPIKLSFADIAGEFKEYISSSENEKIIFSAPFGTGKTTFLTEFFEDSQYNCVFLSPVNYSISSNEDIFELIKYDILYELLGKHKGNLKLETEEFPILLTTQSFLLYDLDILGLLKTFIKNSSKIGKASIELIGALQDEYKKYKRIQADQSTIDEFDILRQYLQKFESKSGPTEYDEFTQLIQNLINRLRETCGRETVLVIDDLDRIDPEHIFRLFNVFSAHYDNILGRNKFGFDKVIFVCDINNIEAIYHHKYGADASFYGYINKFYSHGVFYFRNADIISEQIASILNRVSPVDKENVSPYLFKYHISGSENYFAKTIFNLAKALIHTSNLDLRSLMNMKKFRIKEYILRNSGKFNRRIDYTMIIVFDFFSELFGGLEVFEKKLKRLVDLSISNTYTNREYGVSWQSNILKDCLPFLSNFSGIDDGEAKQHININYENYIIDFEVENTYEGYDYTLLGVVAIGKGAGYIKIDQLDVFHILYTTLIQVRKQNLLS